MALSKEFYLKLNKISSELGMNPRDLLCVMAYESGLNPGQLNHEVIRKRKNGDKNAKGAVGLIQFMPQTLKDLGVPENEIDNFGEKSAEDQLDYVRKYIKGQMSFAKRSFKSATEYYHANFFPLTLTRWRGQDPIENANVVVVSRDSKDQRERSAYAHNKGLDTNNDGNITVSDLTTVMMTKANERGFQSALAGLNSVAGAGDVTEINLHPNIMSKSIPALQMATKRAPSSSESFLDRMNTFFSSLIPSTAMVANSNNDIKKKANGPLEHGHAREVLREAYKNLFHKDPSDGELDFGLATAFFETGYGYGHGGTANWSKPDQFARWAVENKYNWGGLQTNQSGEDSVFKKFQASGLHPIKEKSMDANRQRYFYLFPNDLEAATAFLMSWGKPAILSAAATGDHNKVAKSMRDHNYYEGLWVPPGNPKNLPMPPFKEANSAEEAEQNNIREYANALKGKKTIVTKPAALPQLPPPSNVNNSTTTTEEPSVPAKLTQAYKKANKPSGPIVQPLEHGHAREALKEAYKNLFHREPSDGELDFGLATAFFETGYGRAGAANWAHPGQFAKWASQGKFNWGALESGIPGPERTFEKFKKAGLHPTKEKGNDAGRPAYFYLFPTDIEAATAFLMSWGQADTLKAAASGSPEAVAKSMKNHNYYEGFWVPPGNPKKYKMPPFKEAKSAEEAERNNIRDYASALNGHRTVVTGKHKKPEQQMAKRTPQSSSGGLEGFLERINNFFASFASTEDGSSNFLIVVGAEDFATKTEYARILQSVFEEELQISPSIHYAGNDLELSCSLPFEKKESFEMLNEVCSAVSDVFEFATQKIGGCKTSTAILAETSSKYPEMDIKIAEINRRQFKIKIAQGSNASR